MANEHPSTACPAQSICLRGCAVEAAVVRLSPTDDVGSTCSTTSAATPTPGLGAVWSKAEEVINRNMGESGLMLFLEFDHGAVVRKETGLAKPKIMRLVIGNPLVMKEMAKHVPDAGSYAPVTVLVDERDDGVHLSYDRMTSFLSPYENRSKRRIISAANSYTGMRFSTISARVTILPS